MDNQIPSFLRSTLSICFIICVLAVLVMVFMWITPDQVTFGVVTAVISAYLTNYGSVKEPKPNTVTITDTTKTQESIDNIKEAIAPVITPIDDTDLESSKLEAYDPDDKQ